MLTPTETYPDYGNDAAQIETETVRDVIEPIGRRARSARLPENVRAATDEAKTEVGV
jgi:hypothetical protein